MHVLKPHVSLNISDIDASVAFYERVFVKGDVAAVQDHSVQTAAACCAPSSLSSRDEPVQLGKTTGCC
jgi:hypothetical protein